VGLPEKGTKATVMDTKGRGVEKGVIVTPAGKGKRTLQEAGVDSFYPRGEDVGLLSRQKSHGNAKSTWETEKQESES